MVEKLLRRSRFPDLAAVHEEDPCPHLPGKAHLVGDDHHGHAHVGQTLDQIQDLPHHLGVQSGGGFVEKHHLRVHGEGAHDGDPLLLPARKGRGIDVRLILQPDALKKLQRALLSLRLCLGVGFPLWKKRKLLFPEKIFDANDEVLSRRGAPVLRRHRDGRQHDILKHRHIVEEIELLKNHADVTARVVDVHPHVGKVFSLEIDRAARGILHAVDAAQKGRLARAGGADHDDLLPVLNGLGDLVKHQKLAVFLSESFDFDHFSQASFPSDAPERKSSAPARCRSGPSPDREP